MGLELVSFDVAREAARIRASTAVRTPDATILATAVVAGAEAVVTNDGRWASAVSGARLGLSLCRLDEHGPGVEVTCSACADGLSIATNRRRGQHRSRVLDL
jgi:hypothetical protein